MANSAQINNDKQEIIVDGSQCIGCGSCFDVCQHDARSFSDDTERFFADLQRGEAISLLIAPAFFANYPKESYQILGALKKLGVNRMINVGFGADITTWAYIHYIKSTGMTGAVSQPCPAVVDYIEKYIPNLIPKLIPIHSPMMCAAVYVKKYQKLSDKLAFISPCIAKKKEIDSPNTKGYVSYNVTFEHLMQYIKQHHITGTPVKDEIECGMGAIYPTPGGLKENVYWFCGEDVFIRQIEGERHVYEFLEKYAERVKSNKELPFLVDALNCAEGCLHGTAVEEEKAEDEDVLYELDKIRRNSRNGKTGAKELAQLTPEKRLELLDEQFKSLDIKDFSRAYTDQSSHCQLHVPSRTELESIFTSLRKKTQEERQINCGACGYKTCYDMATAIYNKSNKRQNCIHYERSKVLEEKQKIEDLTNQMKEKNAEIASFVEKDFNSLDEAINNVSEGNEQTAAESQEIQSTMLEIKEFCDNLNRSFQDIMVLLDSLEGNNRDITSLSKKTTLLSLNASIEAARTEEITAIAETVNRISESVRTKMQTLTN